MAPRFVRFHEPIPPATLGELLIRRRHELGLTRDQLLAFGRRRPDDHWEPFGMTPLAMRFARSVNGVVSVRSYIQIAG